MVPFGQGIAGDAVIQWAVGMAIALLAASWFKVSIAGFDVNVASAATIVLMTAVCFHSFKGIWTPLTVLDVLMTSIVVWHIVVDVHYGMHPINAFAEAYSEWALPYVTGRFAAVHRHAVATYAPWIVIAGIFFGVAAVVESLTSINFWEKIISPIDDAVFQPRFATKRYGLLYRAHGPLRHPIFLGVLFLMLMPWAVVLIESEKSSRRFRALGVTGLIVGCLGIAATVSRGPMIALCCAVAFYIGCVSKLGRWMVIGTLVAVAILVGVFRNETVGATEDQLDRR